MNININVVYCVLWMQIGIVAIAIAFSGGIDSEQTKQFNIKSKERIEVVKLITQSTNPRETACVLSKSIDYIKC